MSKSQKKSVETVETELNTQETGVEMPKTDLNVSNSSDSQENDITQADTQLNAKETCLNESKKIENENFAVFCIKENKFAFITEEQFDIYNHKRV